MLKKRSVSIRGHSTSFSLEDAFWAELKAIARRQKKSVAQLVTQVDTARLEGENLSSALRVHVLKNVKESASSDTL